MSQVINCSKQDNIIMYHTQHMAEQLKIDTNQLTSYTKLWLKNHYCSNPAYTLVQSYTHLSSTELKTSSKNLQIFAKIYCTGTVDITFPSIIPTILYWHLGWEECTNNLDSEEISSVCLAANFTGTMERLRKIMDAVYYNTSSKIRQSFRAVTVQKPISFQRLSRICHCLSVKNQKKAHSVQQLLLTKNNSSQSSLLMFGL